jgi:hypothetical protein
MTPGNDSGRISSFIDVRSANEILFAERVCGGGPQHGPGRRHLIDQTIPIV